MKKILAGLFLFSFLFVGSQVHASTLSDALLKIKNLTKEVAQLKTKLGAYALGSTPSETNVGLTITLESNPQADSSGHVIIKLGSAITFTGFPNNLTGNISTDFTRSFNFDPIFNDVCNQNGSNEWSQKCTPTHPGEGSFYIQITKDGKIYNSNVIRVVVEVSDRIDPLEPIRLATTPTSDLTPRISYWYGKVNQHLDIASSTIQTDSDGVSGADLDKLEYCKKFYPNTVSVVEYKNETFNSWYTAGNTYNYTSTKMSYKCIEGTVVPTSSITVLSPNGREVYQAGQQITIKWKSSSVQPNSQITITLTNVDNGNVIYLTSDKNIPAIFSTNDGIETFNIPTSEYSGIKPGNYKITISTLATDKKTDIRDESNLFTINFLTSDNGCSHGEVYSSTTGQKCPRTNAPSITVLSPNGGETFTQGSSNRISWSGGKNKIQIGLFSNYNQAGSYAASNNGIVGWIFTNLVKDVNPTSGPWDGISLTDLSGSGIGSVTPGKYKIVAISESDAGNYCLGDKTNCNSDLSDDFITIKSASTTDTGCGDGRVYSSTSGQVCPIVTPIIDKGCTGANYSSTTGNRCPINTIKVDEGCNGVNKYSNTTGQICKTSHEVPTGPFLDSTNYVAPTPLATSTITTPITRTLKLGIKGEDVKALQDFLNLLADGSFGPKTQAKVMEWQAANDLTADGSFGRMSREKAGLSQ